MHKNSAKLLWVIFIGNVATIKPMGPPPEELRRRPVSMAFAAKSKKLKNGLTLRSTKGEKKKSEGLSSESTIQFANGSSSIIPPQRKKEDIFGDIPPPPEGYQCANMPSKLTIPEGSPIPTQLFGNRTWQPEEQPLPMASNNRSGSSDDEDAPEEEERPYAMASDVRPEPGFEYANAPSSGIPVPTVIPVPTTISESHSAPPSPPKEEEEPPSLRKTVSDGDDNKKPKPKRHVSLAVRSTLRGLMRQGPPPDEKKKRSSSATVAHRVIVQNCLTPENPDGNSDTAMYGNVKLVTAEEEEQYGNDPRFFTEQLQELLQENSPSIPQALRLITGGANPCAKNKKGKTLLHVLAEGGNEGGIRHLCESGDTRVDLNVPNNSGETPFISAFTARKFGAAAELLKYGAVLTPFIDSQGNSESHVAAKEGSQYFAEQLLAKGVDMNSQNSAGQTPLHCAILHDKPGIAKWFIQNNVALLPDKNGKEPLDYAVPMGSLSVVAALLKRDEYPLEPRQRLAQKTKNEKIRNLLLQTNTQAQEPTYAALGQFEE